MNDTIASMIRVNQAGEYGAKRIYEGQLDALSHHPQKATIQHMKDQEQEHLDTFNDLLVKKRVRPTVLHPLWHVGGYCLGYITGKMGYRAAMACTVAVEEVIDAHYAEQEEILKKSHRDPKLQTIVQKFRQEEAEHRDIGLEHGAEKARGYGPLTKGITAVTKAAIWLSKRI